MKMFKCACGTGGIVVVRVDDNDDGDFFFIELAFWQIGHGNNYNWKFRLRTIWNIIKYGHPWTDMVLLKRNTARKLGEHLIEISKGKEK